MVKEQTFWWLSLFSIGLFVLVMCATWWIDPVRAFELRNEGRFFENLTVILYLLASIAGTGIILARRPDWIYVVVPIGGVR